MPILDLKNIRQDRVSSETLAEVLSGFLGLLPAKVEFVEVLQRVHVFVGLFLVFDHFDDPVNRS